MAIPPARRLPLLAAAAAGLVGAGSALAVGEIVAVPISPDASPYVAVGATMVDSVPAPIRDWAINTFGTSDKVALFVGMGIVIAVVAIAAGLLERRRRPLGAVVIGLFGVVGAVAAIGRPGSTWQFPIPALLAGLVGAGVLYLLGSLLRDAHHDDGDGDDELPKAGTGVSRRFLLAAGGIAGVAILVGGVGRRLLSDAARTLADRAGLVLPQAANPAPPIPPGADIGVDGATSFVTANQNFYRIDTALQVPRLTTDEWSLRIHGEVDQEVRLSWDDLVAMPMTERLVTLACVSNDVGGDLIGNARWLGVPMRDVLARAGVRPGADMLFSTSADGWTCGTPVSAVTDGRDAMLAIAMNGEPLPIEHGYPVRQVVPGLFGYVSATKWVVDWQLTSFDKAKAYWTTRGWSAMGPIKMSSRIDRPTTGATLPAGEVIVAGTAWAQHTGIEAVDVRVDGGPWQRADLATEYSIDTWRQWRFAWQATKGEHTVECRAIDKAGKAQVEDYASTAPDGATGLDFRGYTIT